MEGDPIFSETVYLLNPTYIHKRSPEFSLVSKGKHITGLFKIALNNIYLGDWKEKAIIIFLLGDGLKFDLFLTDLPPAIARQMLLEGKLNEAFLKAREEAVNV